MAQFIKDFFTVESVWALVFIFVFRIIEVAIGTLRIILINKEYRTIGVILAFFEVLIWVFVASRVIDGITEEPLKGIIYSLGFATGVYVGSKIENKLAFGKVLIQAITTEDLGIVIANVLRTSGYGVTIVKGQGKDSMRSVLMIYANRRNKDFVFSEIDKIDPNAMVVSNEVSNLKGGFLSEVKRFVK